MSPAGGPHGFVENNVGFELKKFVDANNLGWVQSGEVGIYTRRNPDTVRGADVIFISKKRLGKLPQRGFLEIAPELVVEIVSPGDSKTEIKQKIFEYFDAGVDWVWMVDPPQRTCTVYRSPGDSDKLTENEHLIGEGILEGLRIKISKFFLQ